MQNRTGDACLCMCTTSCPSELVTGGKLPQRARGRRGVRRRVRGNRGWVLPSPK
ncbi:hypothetical protein DAI22_08g189400 [Oryza sativa Japonica Group]|nr:hypothetical protein DAI22_08g189400 [Oryza sativa Japonica Group]